MAITLPTSSGPDTLTPTTHEEVWSTIEQAQVLNWYATKLYALCENFAATLQEGWTLSDLESRFREGIESLSIRSTKMVDGSPFIAVSGRQRTSQHKRLIGEVIDFLWENIMAPSLKKKNGSDDIYIFEGKKVENRLKSIFWEFIEWTEPHPMIDPKDTLDSAVSANIGALLSNLQYDLRERWVNKMLIEKHTIAWPLLISILAGAAFTMNMSWHAIENLLIEAAVKDPKWNSWLLDETLRSLISYGLWGIVWGTLGYTWHELARSTKAWAKAGIKKTKRNTTRLLWAFWLASALSLWIYGTDYLGTNAGAVKGFHNLNEA
jgi:hypothetical protein